MLEANRPATPDETYDDAFFARLFDIEDRHFWFRARNRIISLLAGQIVDAWPAGYRALEVGCGTGNVLQVLEKTCAAGQVVGLDQSKEGLHFARMRTNCELIEGDARSMSFTAPFDLIGLFDVLEHIPDDLELLRDLRTLLRPGGALLLTVPANPRLWSYFDEASRHCRRYSTRNLETRLNEAGYRIEYVTYYMASLFPLIWLGRRLASTSRGRSSHKDGPVYEMAIRELRVIPVVNELLMAFQSWERLAVARRYHLPFGSSVIALARSRDR